MGTRRHVIRRVREHRAIAGLSMGGGQALHVESGVRLADPVGDGLSRRRLTIGFA